MTATIPSKPQQSAPWWEIVLVIAVSLGISLFLPTLKTLAVLLPVAYLLIESWLRKRRLSENGFRLRTFPQDLLHNLGWVLLVGIGTQALAVFGARLLLPEYFAHVTARLPFDLSLSAPIIISLLLSTLGEEIIFRALFQQRLSAFLSIPAAILISSLVFALMHYTAGPALIVFVDLAFVFIDSIIYGIIFARSRNVFVAWAAHFLADIVGLIFLLMVIQ